MLFYVARTPDDTLIAHLRSRSWNVMVARSAHELARLVKPDVVCAGIVDLASFPPRDLGGLEASLRQQQIGWIALATAGSLNDPVVRRLDSPLLLRLRQDTRGNATIDYLVSHAFGMVTLCEPRDSRRRARAR